MAKKRKVEDQVVPEEVGRKEDAATTSNLPSEDFSRWINDVPMDAKRIYGKTPVGQWFCLVLITLIEVCN